MGDGLISRNYTKWDALGWDWQPAIRDREMGITGDVYLFASGPLEINNVYVTADLPLPDTTSAKLTVSGSIVNHSLKPQKGLISGTISCNNTEFSISQSFKIAPNQVLPFLWNEKSFADLLIRNPELWWPAGYGRPALYRLKLQVTAGKEKASYETTFGIREIETYIGAKERVYKINGKNIYCKGGNWVTDMMLNWNARRYEDEILLTRNANLNILRVWGPTGVPPQSFYDAADKYGIMIWQDFLYDYWGTFRNRPGYNTSESLYETITTGIVKEYRNHPSLVIWCGGNEGANPREKLITEKILPENDGRDSKHYLKISNGDGLHGGGPYHTLHPKDYFSDKKLNGFSSEIGPSGVPVMESIRKFMPDLGKNYMQERFPINVTWSYHDANDWAGSDSRKFSSYDNLIRQLYGAPAANNMQGVENYLAKTQLLNYDVYRSAIEAINRQIWSRASGILLWKSNSSWPSMVWQIYDWYLQANAGYYGAKSASESVHIQMNRDSLDIVVLNAFDHPVSNVTVSAVLYNLKAEAVWQQKLTTVIAGNGITRTGWVVPVDKNEVQFLRLSVTGQTGEKISENTYWINESYDFTSLSNLQPAEVSGKMIKKAGRERTDYDLEIKNEGHGIAFMIQCTLRGAASGMELLPSLWNDNFITLMPGEKVHLSVSINNQDITETPVISCKAFNMEKEIIVSGN
jgi:beta-galactosidase/beta-glucuronidase